MTFRQAIILLALIFVIVLAVLVARQMSTEAMAVVIGIVCGVLAGIPTSLLMLVALSRRDIQQAEKSNQLGRQAGYPPVIVVQGGMPQAFPAASQAGYWPSSPPGPSMNRAFNVVGGDDLYLGDGVQGHSW